ncbi:anaerobic ribonucleoside-triphosphate reductase activating protein [Eggerthellaceae bacterium zg-997]|nr:anaerobic ribonucleoside-triphosphate reductase activating protein [Eggerthellaceae bacterium zg-997]
MHYGNIKYFDVANGEGVRTSVFVSGCTHRCPHCFQPQTWSFEYGQPFDDETLAQVIESLDAPFVDGLTVLGGEPLEPRNQERVADLVEAARARQPRKSIWVYTGDVYESLVREGGPRRTAHTDRILSAIDILVDGPFVQDLHDITLRFRGSSNQRIIDVPRTQSCGRICLWRDHDIYESHAKEQREALGNAEDRPQRAR